METEMLRLWNLATEISDQLNQNRLVTSRLQNHAGQLHEQATHVSDGVTIRRFNTDLSKETFTSELERLSAALVIENQSLLHENKQLSTLLNDYEKTLETVMTKFRGHCNAAQTHQQTLNRHYETLLAQERSEETAGTRTMDVDHLQSLNTFIVRALRSIDGQDPLQEEPVEEDQSDVGELDKRGTERAGGQPGSVGDWVEEREAEIQRLERENVELRRALGISPEQERELGLEDSIRDSPIPSPSWERPSFSRSRTGHGSFREDRIRGGARAALGLGGGPPRRPSLFGRGGFDGPGMRMGMGPERVVSPPNDIPWGRDGTPGPTVDSI